MLLKQNQQKTCSLCGHRILYSAMKIEKRLFQEIENLIKDGCSIFKIGTHGAFDQLALSVCRQLKTQYPHIKIQVVFTSLSAFVKDEYGFCLADLYKDVETITYPIEDVYFKKQITMCNRMMINDSDIIVCYVDKSKSVSGAKAAMNYAERNNKKVINLYREEDDPFYGLTTKEIEKWWKDIKKIIDKK